MTNKERFLNLVSGHDYKTMEDVVRRVKHRKILNIINRLKLLIKKEV